MFKGRLLTFFLVAFWTITSFTKNQDVVLVNEGKSSYIIVYPFNATNDEIQAAKILQSYLREISGVQISVASDTLKETNHEILIGNTNRSIAANLSKVKPGGFLILTKDQKMMIAGNGERSTLFGVYHFLEQYLHCRMFASDLKIIPQKKTINLPELNDLQNPALAFRSVYYHDAEHDEEYLNWHKLQRIEQAWGLWGHTFNILVPPAEYFKSHPEYFAEIQGRRQATQLCLTNPEVLQIIISNLSKKIKQNPYKQYWSVSQNDGTGYCECKNCKALNDKYHSPQGSIISLVNQVAGKFPDKIITTMAYSYSRPAPIGLRPAKNVSVLLSDIEVKRGVPIETDPSSRNFRTDFQNWLSVTKNIIVWDYVVQFTNYISPFPNLGTLKPNLDYLRAENIHGVFEQGSVEVSGEFSELKSYLLAKLLWNPKADIQALQNEFLEAYYGKGSGDIGKYIKLLQQQSNNAGGRLDIYGNPIAEHSTFLSPELLNQYKRIINHALGLVKNNTLQYKHVLAIKLGLDYATFQQAKFFGIEKYGVFDVRGTEWVIKPHFENELNTFIKSLKLNHITQLNEAGTTPEIYLNDWQEILKNGPKLHKANHKPIKALTEFYPDYSSKGIDALVDGVAGLKDPSFNWVEWIGNDMSVLVDMEKVTPVNHVSVNFLECQKYQKFLPAEVRFEVSTDNKHFKELGRQFNTFEENNEIRIRTTEINLPKSVKARYIKITARNRSYLQSGRSSILADEVVIN